MKAGDKVYLKDANHPDMATDNLDTKIDPKIVPDKPYEIEELVHTKITPGDGPASIHQWMMLKLLGIKDPQYARFFETRDVSEKITVPFSTEVVFKLNDFQLSGAMHPFTCSNDGDEEHIKYEFEKNYPGKKYEKDYESYIAEKKASGVNYPHMEFTETKLIATEEGWHCPVCSYKQKWAHGFMAK